LIKILFEQATAPKSILMKRIAGASLTVFSFFLLFLSLSPQKATGQCLGSVELNVIASPEPEITELAYQCNGEITLDAGAAFFTNVRYSL
jgi:hypothetical protein